MRGGYGCCADGDLRSEFGNALDQCCFEVAVGDASPLEV